MTLSDFFDFLNKWQTLITGMLAVIAAYSTIQVMNKQILEEQTRYQDSIARRAVSTRATMLYALNDLCSYAEDCFDYIHDATLKFPDRPSLAITSFTNSLEVIEDKNLKPIYEMLSFFQVQEARLKRRHTELTSNRNAFEASISDLITLNYYFIRVFEFARGEKNYISQNRPTYDDKINSLNALDKHSYRRSPGLQFLCL